MPFSTLFFNDFSFSDTRFAPLLTEQPRCFGSAAFMKELKTHLSPDEHFFFFTFFIFYKTYLALSCQHPSFPRQIAVEINQWSYTRANMHVWKAVSLSGLLFVCLFELERADSTECAKLERLQ